VTAPTERLRVLHGWFTIGDVAGRLHVSTRTLRRWRAVGYGPPWFRQGRRVFYDRALFGRWIEANTVHALPEPGWPRRRLLHIVGPPITEQPPDNVVTVDRWGPTS
jgi:hypothetical protein